jgi:uncharacterized protein with ParB-like and HNH nuclease domain
MMINKIKNLFDAKAARPSENAMLYNGGIGFRVPEYQRQYDSSQDNINRLLYDCLSGFFRLGTSDLPLNRHPAAIRASAVCVTPWGAG